MLVRITSKLQGNQREIVEQINTIGDLAHLLDDFDGRELLIKKKDEYCKKMYGSDYLEMEVQ